jgi:hypothetical protein
LSLEWKDLRKALETRGLGLVDLVAYWPRMVKNLEIKARSDAALLLSATRQHGILSLADYLEKHPPSALVIAALVEKARELERSTRAANAAAKKNAPARAWVQGEWKKHRHDYGNNKSEFARVYAKRISNEFKGPNGDPVKVRPDRIAQFWLAE